MVAMYPHQIEAVQAMGDGKILWGDPGCGKSRIALMYFYTRVGEGSMPVNGGGLFSEMKKPMDLYIITTAKKRDGADWDTEASLYGLRQAPMAYEGRYSLIIDSWNNIGKYASVTESFFIFDEQRVVGSGAWVKSFLKIAKNNRWILLSGTPGDTWMDYIPVFVANGHYKNKTEFLDQHVMFSRFAKYPKVERFFNTRRLEAIREQTLVPVRYDKRTVRHKINVPVQYDRKTLKMVMRDRWDIYNDEPVRDASRLAYVIRRVLNEDWSRYHEVVNILFDHKKAIVFYNFNYELEILRNLNREGYEVREWNGSKHEELPDGDSWVYLVQYTAGAEGWNCTTTDATIFYSLNYSYRVFEQSMGRIDRLNTPYNDLYYYILKSSAGMDMAISRALSLKKNFNEKAFLKF